MYVLCNYVDLYISWKWIIKFKYSLYQGCDVTRVFVLLMTRVEGLFLSICGGL